MHEAVELSVCMGIGPCGCPIFSSEVLSTSPSLALINRPLNSAYSAESITFFIMVATTNIAPLFFVCDVWLKKLLRKKCPPTLIIDLDADRYDASLCILNFIWLAQYLILASLWV